MEGQSSATVECGKLAGGDGCPATAPRGRPPHHEYQPTEYHDVLYLDDADDADDDGRDMTADTGGLPPQHHHRRTPSPADCYASRKSNKPLMEKKRRQRINRCLHNLKGLVLEAMNVDPSRYSKLEKADILEMTLRYVQGLQRHEGSRLAGEGSDEEAKYRAGYSRCAKEVAKYLSELGNIPTDLHNQLIAHLNTIASSVTANVNTNTSCVQSNVNVLANPTPIILVLNTTTGAPPPAHHITFHDNPGNSMGAQPPVTFVTTSRLEGSGMSAGVQQQPATTFQVLPSHTNTGDVRLVLPPTHQVVPQSFNTNIKAQPSSALQASAPVLSAILTSSKGRDGATVVKPPALSTSSVDSALGAEMLDTSDSDLSSSEVGTPLSSLSSADSPVPMEEAGRISPKKIGGARCSPTHKPQMWSSNTFREELPPSSSPARSAGRRQPPIAPKPTCPGWNPRPTPMVQSVQSPKKPKERKNPEPAPVDPESMWRPWH